MKKIKMTKNEVLVVFQNFVKVALSVAVVSFITSFVASEDTTTAWLMVGQNVFIVFVSFLGYTAMKTYFKRPKYDDPIEKWLVIILYLAMTLAISTLLILSAYDLRICVYQDYYIIAGVLIIFISAMVNLWYAGSSVLIIAGVISCQRFDLAGYLLILGCGIAVIMIGYLAKLIFFTKWVKDADQKTS